MMKYKNYKANIQYSDEDHVFHGRVVGVKSIISFEGKSVEELEEDFKNAIEHYLDMCKRKGKTPEKPTTVNFHLRLQPEIYQKAVEKAKSSGESLNTFLSKTIAHTV